MIVDEQLDRAVAVGSCGELEHLLADLDEAGLATARAWYRKRGRASARRRVRDADLTRQGDQKSDPVTVSELLAVHCASSAVEAAKAFTWRTWFATDSGADDAVILLRALASRGRDWCAQFCRAGSEVKPPSDVRKTAGRLVRVTMPLLAFYGLPMPTGAGFPPAWIAYYGRLMSFARWAASGRAALDGVSRVGQPWLTSSGDVVVDDRPLLDCSLHTLLAADPVVADALSASLAVPGLFGQLLTSWFSSPPMPSWQLGPAVAALVQTGHLERRRVVDDCLTALTRRDTPATQRGIAKVLVGLALRGDDVTDRLPLMQGVVATAHGSVTAAVLPALLEAVRTPADIDELASTVFGRAERKQRHELLKALSEGSAVARYGRDGVIAGLRHAAGSDDPRTAQRAQQRLASLGEVMRSPTVDASASLWTMTPPASDCSRFEPAEPTPAGLTRLVSSLAVRTTPVAAAAYYDALTRAAYRDVTSTRAWMRSSGHHGPATMQLAVAWSGKPADYADHVDSIKQAAYFCAGTERPWENGAWMRSAQPTSVFAWLFAEETALRLGNAPLLLSTPSFDNGVLTFDDLLARLKALSRFGYGPFDLAQALLRLEPVPVERAEELDGLTLAPWTTGGRLRRLFGGARGGEDGVEVIRAWVAGRGASYPDAVITDGEWRVPAPELPAAHTVFEAAPPLLLAGHAPETARRFYWWDNSMETTVGVLPNWPEYLAAVMHETFVFASDATTHLPFLAGLVGAGHAGPGVHELVARTLSHADPRARLVGVDAGLTLIGRGEFNPDLFADTCGRLLTARELPLARTCAALEQLVLAGAIRQVWPAVCLLADRASSAPRRPAGTAELLSLLHRFGDAAIHPVPAGVVALATTRGSSQAHLQARALLAHLREGTAR